MTVAAHGEARVLTEFTIHLLPFSEKVNFCQSIMADCCPDIQLSDICKILPHRIKCLYS